MIELFTQVDISVFQPQRAAKVVIGSGKVGGAKIIADLLHGDGQYGGAGSVHRDAGTARTVRLFSRCASVAARF